MLTFLLALDVGVVLALLPLLWPNALVGVLLAGPGLTKKAEESGGSFSTVLLSLESEGKAGTLGAALLLLPKSLAQVTLRLEALSVVVDLVAALESPRRISSRNMESLFRPASISAARDAALILAAMFSTQTRGSNG